MNHNNVCSIFGICVNKMWKTICIGRKQQTSNTTNKKKRSGYNTASNSKTGCGTQGKAREQKRRKMKKIMAILLFTKIAQKHFGRDKNKKKRSTLSVSFASHHLKTTKWHTFSALANATYKTIWKKRWCKAERKDTNNWYSFEQCAIDHEMQFLDKWNKKQKLCV